MVIFEDSAHYPQFEEKENFMNGCVIHFRIGVNLKLCNQMKNNK